MRTTMTPHAAYRARATTAVPRIDLLLSLYSGAIERIDAARAATKAGQANLATAKLARAQLLVSELAAGVRPDIEPEVNVPILRLLEFVVAQLAAPADAGLASAIKVLSSLRDGFRGIRNEALELERTGQIPPAEAAFAVSALA